MWMCTIASSALEQGLWQTLRALLNIWVGKNGRINPPKPYASAFIDLAEKMQRLLLKERKRCISYMFSVSVVKLRDHFIERFLWAVIPKGQESIAIMEGKCGDRQTRH